MVAGREYLAGDFQDIYRIQAKRPVGQGLKELPENGRTIITVEPHAF